MVELVSKYKPSGDQPQAIKELVTGINEGKKEQVLLGATGTGKTFTIANVIKETNKPTLVLAHNKTLAGQLYAELKEFFPNNHVEYFVSYYDYYQPEAYVPSSDTYIEKDSSINDEIDELRHAATSALINYKDGEKRYIIAPNGLKVGMIIENGESADIKVGNALPLKNIPVGTMVHCIELQPGKGAEMCRSAGAGAQILGREGKYVMLRLQSGETRLVLGTCIATIGVVGNEDYKLVNLGKAGRKRHMGIRPTNRGSVMNPNDHPHGGGEGRAPIGRKSPMTPWGKPALGVKTRKSKKKSEKLIVSRKAKK